jgi:hypothetical protein
MRMSRWSARSRFAIRSLVELLPQSRAATTSVTHILNAEVRKFDFLRHERANWIVRAHEVVGEMRVEALHPSPGPADATVRLDQVDAYRRVTSALFVLSVRASKLLFVHQLLKTMNATVAFQATHGVVQLAIDEPEQCRHRRAVAQVRFVLNDHRTSVEATDDDSAATGERPPKKTFNQGPIFW